MTWLKDGERYSRLENNKQTGGTDIVAYQAKDNSREVIIPSSLLTDKSTGKPIPARSISWSADNEKVLIYNNTQRVWRYDTRGDYWVLNLSLIHILLFQLTINVAACLIVLLGSLLGTESPLTITQMLWVNLIMDTFAAGALASLPPNERVMKDKPRRSGKDGDFIITRPMAYNIFGVGFAFVVILMGLLFYFHAQDGLTPHDLSWFFSFFVMLQFWNMFNAKAFMEGRSAFANLKDSKSFLLVALLILIGQYLIVTFGGEMFSVIPLSLRDWAIIIGSSSLVLWIGELFRLSKR